MPEPEDIEAQRELLRVYRRNLALYLRQQAEQGGPTFVTPAVANGIVDARAEIVQIKTILRGWSQAVDDHPNDLPASTAPAVVSAPKHSRATAQSEPLETPPIVTASATAAIDPDGLEAYFTDVEYLRDAFRQLVSASTLPKRLLVIHGVGGAGKSSLLRMFRIYARRAGVPIALASGDEVKSVVDLLARWSDDLQADGVRLPTTAKTLARYRGVQTTVEQQAQKASTVAGKLAVKTAEGVAGSVAGAAIGSVFPVIGTVAGAAVGALVGTGGEAFSEWLGTFLKRPDIELVLDPTRELTNAFLADLDTAAQRRMVLLLDTFEQLSALEDWARDFAQRLHHNVLLVIGGRAVPGWGRAWLGWLSQARVEELKPMTPEIMRDLIRRYYATVHGGDPDPAQVEAIISFARGLPVVVTSAVQLWVAYGVEDFQSVKPQVVADLVDRLLEGVPRELVPMLEAAAAALRWFNKDILRAVTRQDDVNTAYDELRRFPFIRPRVEGLALHDAVREIMDANLRVHEPERHSELHARAAAYFETRLIKATRQEAEQLVGERLYHRIHADEEIGIKVFQEMAEELVRYHLMSKLRMLLIEVNSYPLERQNSQLWRKYYNARLAQQEGNLAEAEPLYYAIGTSEQAEPKLMAYALCDLGHICSYWERLGQPGGVERAERFLQQSKTLLPEIDRKLVSVFSHLQSISVYKGEWSKTLELLEQQLRLLKQRGDIYGAIHTLSSLRVTYGQIGDWKRAAETTTRGLQMLEVLPDSAFLRARLVGFGPWNLIGSGQYFEAERELRNWMSFLQHTRSAIGVLTGITAFIVGLQGKYNEAIDYFTNSIESYQELQRATAMGSILALYGKVLIQQGELDQAEAHLTQSLSLNREIHDNVRMPEVLNWLGELHEVKAGSIEVTASLAELDAGTRFYEQCLDLRSSGRHYFTCAALTGLVRVKHAQGDYAAIPPLLAEAEALALLYEYNDHLASLRLSQAQLAWDVRLPALGRGFDAALAYYKQALIYALRYNRFLLDEVLWGGGVSTPLKPIIPHCLERTFEGQQMLTALRDWWQAGVNDIGTPRPDTISPIPEGITLLEAEHIAREREAGDRTPQRTVLEQYAGHLNGRSGA
jgi:tetratricopeptide (TPR) repeat protein